MNRPPVVVRDRYHSVHHSLSALSAHELSRLAARAHNQLGPGLGPAGVRRALDPRPELMHPVTWAALEKGLVERVALLEALASDVYGPQLTVARGVLPPEALWSSPLLTRAAIGRQPPAGRWLVHASIDVGLPPSGQPMLLGAETATLAGLGLAYQNRQTTAQLLPGPFTRAGVRRLLPFLDRLRSGLADLAETAGGRARVVILSPPRLDPGHDDVALLARTLGYTLVEGADLTVRGGTVHVRSLAGLEPIDVVLRLLADAQCDPLDLDAASLAGTPGLVAAAWRGRVALANPIGTGWLSSPALVAFLPALSRALLGTEPTLDGPTSWWCGEAEGRAAAVAAIDDVTFQPLDGGPGIETRLLSHADKAGLLARMNAEGRNWVAMVRPELAVSDCWVDGGLQPLPTIIRTYAVTDRAGTVVAPGGLTRVLVDGPSAPGGMTIAGPTRDTWVLSTGGSGDDARVRVRLPQVDLSESLPSRAGESLYWLGRYAERAEAVVRLARTVVELAAEAGDERDAPAWPGWLATALDRLTGVFSTPPEAAGGLAASAALALTEPGRLRGLPRTLSALASSAASVEELLSPELSQAVDDAAAAAAALAVEAGGPVGNAGEAAMTAAAGAGGGAGVSAGAGAKAGPGTAAGTAADAALTDGLALRAPLDRLLGDLASIAGLAQETMVRGPGWYLLDAGRRVERAFALIDVFGTTLVSRPVHHLPAGLLEALLSQAASLIAYRRRYRSDPELAAVTGLLVVDATNPRSLRFQLEALAHDIANLPAGGHAITRRALAADAVELAARVARVDPAAIARAARDGYADELIGLLDGIRVGLSQLATGINLQYIAQVPAALLPTGTLPDAPQEAPA